MVIAPRAGDQRLQARLEHDPSRGQPVRPLLGPHCQRQPGVGRHGQGNFTRGPEEYQQARSASDKVFKIQVGTAILL